MNSHPAPASSAFAAFPGLLPWQIGLLGWLCGIWGFRHPLPALAGGALLIAGTCLARRSSVTGRLCGALAVLLAAALGYGAAAWQADSGTTPWRGLRQRVVSSELSAYLPRSFTVSASQTASAFSVRGPSPELETDWHGVDTPGNTHQWATPNFMRERRKVTLHGVVAKVDSAPDRRLRVMLEQVRCRLEDGGEIVLPGYVLWVWDAPPYRVGPGQHVRLTQRIRPMRGFLNSGTWDSGEYWRDRGAFWRVWSRGSDYGLVVAGEPERMHRWRETLRSAVEAALYGEPALRSDSPDRQRPPPEYGKDRDVFRLQEARAVIPALLFGDRFLLRSDRMDQLSLASLSHSLALSGMHLSAVVALGWGLAWLVGLVVPRVYVRVPRPRLTVLLGAPLVAGYVWLGGATPSLSRAALMFACWGVLLWRGRPRVMLDGLFVAVAVLTVADPQALFDLRLQLSALAVLSLALFFSPIHSVLLSVWQAMNTFFRVEPLRFWRQRDAWNAGGGRSLLAEEKGRFGFSCVAAATARLVRMAGMGALGLLAANLSIQLGMLPVTVWNFTSASPWFALNLLWLPVLGLWILPLSLGGLGLAALGIGSAGGASLCAVAAHGVFSAALAPVLLLFSTLDAFQQADWLAPHLALRPSWTAMLGFWCLLAALLARWHGRCFRGGKAWRDRADTSSFPHDGILGSRLAEGAKEREVSPVAVVLAERERHEELKFPMRFSVRGGDMFTVAWLVVGFGLLCYPLLARMVEGTADGVTMSVLDVGQGQAMVITLPGERRILVDGGGFALSSFDPGKGLVAPSLAHGMPPRVERVVNSHPDTDHLAGLTYPLRYMAAEQFVGNGMPASPGNEVRLATALRAAGLTRQIAVAGDVILQEEGLRLEVLHPSRTFVAGASSNNAALVMRLVRNGHGLVLLMGDLERSGIRALLASGADLSAEVLIVPHHGSRNSLVPELYAAVRPRYAISSTGFLNHWKFPAKAVRDALAGQGVTLFDTGRQGQISVRWRGDGPAHVQSATVDKLERW